MKTLPKIYEKDKQFVYTNDKFIYCSSIYQIWSWGASLIEEKYYSSDKPIIPKKNMLKKKNYSIFRFFDLEQAPENYLINKGYKLYEERNG